MIILLNQVIDLYPASILQISLPVFLLLIFLLMLKYILDKENNKPLFKRVLKGINISIIPLLVLFFLIVSYNAIKLLNAT
jgi:hypothetical protein